MMSQIEFVFSNKEKLINQESNVSLIKTDLCNLIVSICEADSSFISKFYEFGMKLSNELFFSDNFKSFSFVMHLLSLLYNDKKKSEKEIVNKIRPFIDHSLKISKNKVNSCPQSRIEVASRIADFDFVEFSDVSGIVNLFITENNKETKDQFNFIALQIIEEFLKRFLSNENDAIFELIVSPFLKN